MGIKNSKENYERFKEEGFKKIWRRNILEGQQLLLNTEGNFIFTRKHLFLIVLIKDLEDKNYWTFFSCM